MLACRRSTLCACGCLNSGRTGDLLSESRGTYSSPAGPPKMAGISGIGPELVRYTWVPAKYTKLVAVARN